MDWNTISSQNTYHTVTVLGIGELQECHWSRKIFTDLHTNPAHDALLSTHVQNIKNDSHSAPLWSAFLTFGNYWVEWIQFRPSKTHPNVRKPLNYIHSTHLNTSLLITYRNCAYRMFQPRKINFCCHKLLLILLFVISTHLFPSGCYSAAYTRR